MSIRYCLLLILIAALPLASAQAADELVRIDSRPGIKVPVYYMKRAGATATVVLLPGGAGGFGKLVDGKPSSPNFLVRAREHFADAGFNVAVMGRNSGKAELDYADRLKDDHLQDIRKVVEFVKRDSGLPVWLIGTSRGTVSATAAAISFGKAELAGMVLTSSVVSHRKEGAVPTQDLAAIRIPVLLLHHEKDACWVCAPRDVPAIIKGLANAPHKKLLMVNGGTAPEGDACESLHHHGFIGMEKEAVSQIAAWIRKPAD